MRPDGFARVSDVLALPRFKDADFMKIRNVVLNNDKNRFCLVPSSVNADVPDTNRIDGIIASALLELPTSDKIDASAWWIRANQGHSMRNVTIDMTRLSLEQLPEVIVHGTYSRAFSGIIEQGLRPMSRQHVHFAETAPEDGQVISGMRSTCELLVYVDSRKSMEEGIVFYRSSNGVILTSGIPNYHATNTEDMIISVPPKVIARIQERRKKKRILFECGELTSEGQEYLIEVKNEELIRKTKTFKAR